MYPTFCYHGPPSLLAQHLSVMPVKDTVACYVHTCIHHAHYQLCSRTMVKVLTEQLCICRGKADACDVRKFGLYADALNIMVSASSGSLCMTKASQCVKFVPACS